MVFITLTITMGSDLDMEIVKFIKSFNTVNTYLLLSIFILAAIVVYFYFINPA